MVGSLRRSDRPNRENLVDEEDAKKYSVVPLDISEAETRGNLMKAAFITRTGGPDVIQFGDVPEPKLARGECLVKVGAVAVNPIDTYVRSGAIPVKQPFPLILGRDLAGTIVESAPGSKHFKVGDRVWATSQGAEGRAGTFGEYAAVHERWLNATPAGAKDEEMAALALVGITAHLGLVHHARLRAHETLFVNGGSGGVGSSVVQIAKILGAKVITTAGNDEKAHICRELGADLVINYNFGDTTEAIRAAAEKGVDVWWETLREPDFERTISLLAMRGRMIVMAGRDARPVFPVGPFYVKDCSIHGFAIFNATAREQRTAANAINRWVAEGKLKARIDRVMPLSQTAEAHRLQQESTVNRTSELTGKLVLIP
jgi:NADPH2:quinone reductase